MVRKMPRVVSDGTSLDPRRLENSLAMIRWRQDGDR